MYHCLHCLRIYKTIEGARAHTIAYPIHTVIESDDESETDWSN